MLKKTMIKHCIILIIFISFYSCTQNKREQHEVDKNNIEFCYKGERKILFDTLDKKSLLKTLFTNSTFKDSEVVWRPNFEDFNFFKYAISEDSLCHSIIYEREILNIEELPSNYKVFLYKTGDIDMDVFGGTIVGIALFEQRSNGNILKAFKKGVFVHEESGIEDTLSFQSFGQMTMPLLKVSGFCGPRNIHIRYYSLTDFHLVFDYFSQEVSADLENGITKTMVNIKDNKFDIVTKECNSKSEKKSIRHFIYNIDTERVE